jgi:hypothetical protein
LEGVDMLIWTLLAFFVKSSKREERVDA